MPIGGGSGIAIPVNRWTLMDSSNSTTFIFPTNPSVMNSPFPHKNMTEFGNNHSETRSGTTVSGSFQYLAWQPKNEPATLEIQGLIYNQTDFNTFQTWTQKTNRLTLTDHLGRSWTVQMKQFHTVWGRNPRRQYRQRYTLTMLVFYNL